MPIRIEHTPIKALGQLAIESGRAAGRQQGQALSLALRERAEQRAERMAARRGEQSQFMLQSAMAAHMARVRQEPDAVVQRQQLRRAASLAQQSNIYTPTQLKQLEIFADLGDDVAFRQILQRAQTTTPTLAMQQLNIMRERGLVDETTYEQNKLRLLTETAPQFVKPETLPVSVQMMPFQVRMSALQKERETAVQWEAGLRDNPNKQEQYKQWKQRIEEIDKQLQEIAKEAQASYGKTSPSMRPATDAEKKSALEENDWNSERARTWLAKRGLIG